MTVAPGEAIEAELSPSVTGVDLAKLPQKRLTVRTADPNGLTALVSLSHLDPETEAFLAKLKIAKRSGAGSSVKFLEIARGEADVYPRFGPTMEWDTAAGRPCSKPRAARWSRRARPVPVSPAVSKRGAGPVRAWIRRASQPARGHPGPCSEERATERPGYALGTRGA